MKLFTLALCVLLCGCGANSIWEQMKYGGQPKNLTVATVDATPVPRNIKKWEATYHHHHHHRSPTPTATPIPTASPTPTVTPSPSPSSTPTPTPILSKAPHGLFEIGGNPLVNPGFGGDRQTIKWAGANPSDGKFNFKNLIDGAAAAKAKGKQYGVSIQSLGTPPDWVIAAGGKLYTYKTPKGETETIVLPFDPVIQPKLVAFVKALCLALDGLVDYITIGEFGQKTESYMPLPADINYPATTTSYIASWVNSCNLFTDTYAANLKQTPFIMAAGNAFNDPGSEAAVTAVINHGLQYPLFGIMQWGLNASSAGTGDKIFFVNKFIKDNDSHPTGFQMTGSQTEPHVGGNLQGTLEDCLNAANALGADFVEVYSQDGENPALQPVLVKFNGLLK